MRSPQGGIFALGTSSHAYLEFDVASGPAGREVVAAVSSLREPRTTMGGVNLVAGFRPKLWMEVVPDDAPPHLEGCNVDLEGVESFTMPATQHGECSGCPGVPTTWSLTRPDRRSLRSPASPSSRTRPRAGRTSTIAT